MEKQDISKEGGGPVYESIHSPTAHNHSDEESVTTVSGSHAEHGVQPTEAPGHVNISRAEADFAELNREFSRSSHLSRTKSRQSRKGTATADVEKAAEDDAESQASFDLETVLRGNRDEEEAAGIKSKKIGVAFEDLTVSGIGGVKSTFKATFITSNTNHVFCNC